MWSSKFFFIIIIFFWEINHNYRTISLKFKERNNRYRHILVLKCDSFSLISLIHHGASCGVKTGCHALYSADIMSILIYPQPRLVTLSIVASKPKRAATTLHMLIQSKTCTRSNSPQLWHRPQIKCTYPQDNHQPF